MKNKLPTCFILKHLKPSYSENEESGIALVMTLLLGTTLFLAMSALVARNIMTKSIAASESYKQIAENAANNGLNQILSEINNGRKNEYLGYLLGIENVKNLADPKNSLIWEKVGSSDSPIFAEVCTDTARGLPKHPQGENYIWPTSAIKESNTQANGIRKENKASLHSYYRLRSYKNPPKSNRFDNGEAKFIIEGMVQREGMKEGQYLARARLERSLKVEAAVLKKNAEDWAVLYAKNYDLGPTKIEGMGLITWQIEPENSKLVAQTCGTEALISTIAKGADQNLKTRIWPVTNQDLKADVTKDLFKSKGNLDQRSGTNSRRLWRIDDTNSYPSGWSNYRRKSVCKDSRWRGLFPICERIDDGSSPTLQSDYYSVVKNVWDFYGAPSRYKGWEIVLSQDEFCPGKTGDCHIYIEHLKLTNSKVLIENNKRPVVVHLVTPPTDLNNQEGSSGIFELSGSSMICGVNQGSKDCNKKAERLIIVSDHDQKQPDKKSNCIAPSFPLKIAGNSLPYAFLHLRQGTVELTDSTTLSGGIWAQNICANNHQLSVTIPDKLMEKNYDLWGWENKNFGGFGRSVSRAIRGSGYDTFQRF
nr:hypothetical protein [Synechococcus sp. AH-551-E05]